MFAILPFKDMDQSVSRTPPPASMFDALEEWSLMLQAGSNPVTDRDYYQRGRMFASLDAAKPVTWACATLLTSCKIDLGRLVHYGLYAAE